jgi:hypothetical protein
MTPQAQRMRDLRQRRRQAGLCPMCGQNPPGPGRLCPPCQEFNRLVQQDWRTIKHSNASGKAPQPAAG